MKHWSNFFIGVLVILPLTLLSCKLLNGEKNEKPTDLNTEYTNSLFLDIYENIIATNCALPACHDGSFEPNFTSPQSMYYTTVLHPIIKNSTDTAFKYRVVPYDTSKSILFERITNCCFIDRDDRMPVLMEELSKNQLDSIANWILLGAPNWNGEFTYETTLE